MEWKTLSITESEDEFNRFTLGTNTIDNSYKELRNKLKNIYENSKFEVQELLEEGLGENAKRKYYLDITFGIELFKLLDQMGFTEYEASQDNIWRYIQLKIVPDIVYDRWQFNADHFYKLSRRIWMKTIWWYVNLTARVSYDDNKAIYDYPKTKLLLRNFNTDTILQLVERPSREGYYLDLNRSIIYSIYLRRDEINTKYANRIQVLKSKIEDKTAVLTRDLFSYFYRLVMTLNTALLKVYDPKLFDDNLDTYSNYLIDEAFLVMEKQITKLERQ